MSRLMTSLPASVKSGIGKSGPMALAMLAGDTSIPRVPSPRVTGQVLEGDITGTARPSFESTLQREVRRTQASTSWSDVMYLSRLLIRFRDATFHERAVPFAILAAGHNTERVVEVILRHLANVYRRPTLESMVNLLMRNIDDRVGESIRQWANRVNLDEARATALAMVLPEDAVFVNSVFNAMRTGTAHEAFRQLLQTDPGHTLAVWISLQGGLGRSSVGYQAAAQQGRLSELYRALVTYHRRNAANKKKPLSSRRDADLTTILYGALIEAVQQNRVRNVSDLDNVLKEAVGRLTDGNEKLWTKVPGYVVPKNMLPSSVPEGRNFDMIRAPLTQLFSRLTGNPDCHPQGENAALARQVTRILGYAVVDALAQAQYKERAVETPYRLQVAAEPVAPAGLPSLDELMAFDVPTLDQTIEVRAATDYVAALLAIYRSIVEHPNIADHVPSAEHRREIITTLVAGEMPVHMLPPVERALALVSEFDLFEEYDIALEEMATRTGKASKRDI